MTIEMELGSAPYLNKARLQDSVAGALSMEGRRAVLHGGTGIWRCYQGKRFSEDVDVYIWKESTLRAVLDRLRLSGLHVFKGKERRYNYYTVSNGSTEISIQINTHKKSGILKSYEAVDGSYTSLYILDPISLFYEKLDTYDNRREERDIYDLKVLTRHVSKEDVKSALSAFLPKLKPPNDMGALKELVYGEAAPSFEELKDYLSRWVR